MNPPPSAVSPISNVCAAEAANGAAHYPVSAGGDPVVRFPNFMAQAGNPLVELYELVIQAPSLFGRLIYVANLWNPQTSRYDRGLPERFRSPETDQALAKWHYTFFVEWLALPLTEKERDIALYSKDSQVPGKTIRELGEAAIPPLVRAEERKFFIQDLTFIQAML